MVKIVKYADGTVEGSEKPMDPEKVLREKNTRAIDALVEQARIEERKRIVSILEDYLLAKEYDLIEERKRIGEWLSEIAKHSNFPAELRAGHERLRRGELPEGSVKSVKPIVDINDSRLKGFFEEKE